ncbi:melanopsin-like [Hydra vulgaris]|uniref:Melanopsin-like n=1 Tax=Hydra vulgaris TaxID=6087 RepID=A0ABM4CSK9_HYDVU
MDVAKVIVTIVTILSTIFNALALFNLCKKRRKSNYIFLCIFLSASDLLQTVLGYLPAIFLKERMENATKWCQISAFFVAFPSFTSIALLTAISFIKAYLINEHFLIGNMIYKKVVKATILCCWIYGLFWSILPLVGVSSYTLEPTKSRCSIKWYTDTNTEKLYLILLLVFCYTIPVSIVLASTMISARFVRSSFKINSSSLGMGDSFVKLFKLREAKVKFSLTLMCLSFITFWTPYAVIGLLSGFARVKHPKWLLETAALFAKLSAMVNPLLYWQKEDFKKKVRKAFLVFRTYVFYS